jgi:hypothetical protein
MIHSIAELSKSIQLKHIDRVLIAGKCEQCKTDDLKYIEEKVAELVNTALLAGKYHYQWNASNIATGMYIYELRTEKFVSVKKMILMK